MPRSSSPSAAGLTAGAGLARHPARPASWRFCPPGESAEILLTGSLRYALAFVAAYGQAAALGLDGCAQLEAAERAAGQAERRSPCSRSGFNPSMLLACEGAAAGKTAR